jgi:uncharacterized membrane protein YqjE
MMSDPTFNAVTIAEAQEMLRQRAETFDQVKAQDRKWFLLRLMMGWTAVVLLPLFGIVCLLMLLHHNEFTSETVTVAATALLVDILGVVLTVWKVVLGNGPTKLGPVTRD